jgi:hypothetical protein
MNERGHETVAKLNGKPLVRDEAGSSQPPTIEFT